MKTRIYPKLLLALGCFALALPAHAGKIKDRQDKQNERIKTGVKNGSLTKNEAKDLRQQAKEIKQFRKEAKADGGGLSKREKKKIRKMQHRLSNDIKEEKHDKNRTLDVEDRKFMENLNGVQGRLKANMGVALANGRISQAEYDELIKKLNRLDEKQADAREDDNISPSEREDLLNHLKRVREEFHAKRNDGDRDDPVSTGNSGSQPNAEAK